MIRMTTARYYLKHKEELNQKSKSYYYKNRDNQIKRVLNYRKKHKEEVKKYMAQYRQKNKKILLKYNQQWVKDHPDDIRELWNKHTHKRKRELGYVPLNQKFEGSNAHHVDKEHVVYIPKELHKNVWHSRTKPDTMKKINMAAWDFLEYGGL